MAFSSELVLLHRQFGFGTWIALITGSVVAYYVLIVSKKPKVHSGNRKISQFLQDHVPLLHKTYWPAFFYWDGRLQSIMGLTKRLPQSKKLGYERELLKLRDGGTIALDFLAAEVDCQEPTKRMRVLFMPGLTSSSNTSYVKTLAMSLVKAGADVVVFNNRGLGDVWPTVPRTYCANRPDDLEDVLAYLKKKFPGEKFFALGTSFGGIVLSLYFTQQPEVAKETFIGSLLISCVFDLELGSSNIERGMNLYLNKGVTKDIQRRFKKHRQVYEGQDWFCWEKLKRCQTVRDFDKAVTIKQFGFDTVEEYYHKSSTTDKLHQLTIPVIALCAEDDPYQPANLLPFEEAGSMLALVTTVRGGHLGFLTGFLPKMKPFHYMEQFTYQLVESVRLQRVSNNNSSNGLFV